MSTVKALIAEAREALESDRTAVQLDTLHGQLKASIGERTDRLKTITARDKTTFSNTPGPERQKVIAEGDLDALRALDDEERAIGSELDVLRNLQGNVRRRLDAQRAREYGQGMPDEYAELDDLLTAQAEAEAAARKARQAAEAKLKEIHSHRQHVIRQNTLHSLRLELPAAAPALLTSYMRVNQYRYHRGPQRVGWFSPTSRPNELKKVAEALGVPVPRPERESVALLAG